MATNRPRSRVRNVTGAGKSVHRRGSGLGTGPVGRPGRTGGFSNSSAPQTSFRPASGGRTRSSGGGLSKLIILLLVLLLGGGGGLTSLMAAPAEAMSPTSPMNPSISPPRTTSPGRSRCLPSTWNPCWAT